MKVSCNIDAVESNVVVDCERGSVADNYEYLRCEASPATCQK